MNPTYICRDLVGVPILLVFAFSFFLLKRFKLSSRLGTLSLSTSGYSRRDEICIHDLSCPGSLEPTTLPVALLQSDTMSHLVKIPGIVIAASGVRAKATRISIQCRSCRNTLTNIAMRPGLEGYALPRKCNT